MKKFNRILSALTSPFALGLFITIFFVAVSFKFYVEKSSDSIGHSDAYWGVQRQVFMFLDRLHQISIDLRLTNRGPRAGSDRVVVLAVDEESIEKFGRWPWSRDLQAQVIDELMNYGASVVGFDIVYAEEEKNSA